MRGIISNSVIDGSSFGGNFVLSLLGSIVSKYVVGNGGDNVYAICIGSLNKGNVCYGLVLKFGGCVITG